MEVRVDRVDDRALVGAQVQEHAVVAELEVGVDQRDRALELAVQRDRRVDRQGRRADAALGAVEGDAPAESVCGRSPAAWACGRTGRGRPRTRADSSCGWTGLAR